MPQGLRPGGSLAGAGGWGNISPITSCEIGLHYCIIGGCAPNHVGFCRCFLSFVFLGGAGRLELSPCNTTWHQVVGVGGKPNSRVHHSWEPVDAPLRKAAVYIITWVQMLCTMMLAGMSSTPLARGPSVWCACMAAKSLFQETHVVGHTVLMLVFASAKVLPEKFFIYYKMEFLNNAGLYASNRHTPLRVCLPLPQACC